MNNFFTNFLGKSPHWYKHLIITFLLVNPIIFIWNPYLGSWCLLLEFIFTMTLALRCYPLQPGGLLVIEAIIFQMTTTETLLHETVRNFEVILLLMFMVAGIYFMKDLLLFIFSKLFLTIRSKLLLALLFTFVSAVLSAFLDALTVIAVIINVGMGLYLFYKETSVIANDKLAKVNTQSNFFESIEDHLEYVNFFGLSATKASKVIISEEDNKTFINFLRSLVMHGAIGTALGGVCTIVGEPQNLLIANRVGWDFIEFMLVMAPITIPCLLSGLLCCVLLEKSKRFGYGAPLPASVREMLNDYIKAQQSADGDNYKVKLIVQGVVFIILVLSLLFHVAAVGFVGLMVIILLTAFTGIIQEREIGIAFEEALPFTALLVVFFAVVAVLESQHTFVPIMNLIFESPPHLLPAMVFSVNGILSMVSDNVFVATVYINQLEESLKSGTISRELYEVLAIAVNTGTNLPSVATPNGQAAFLFLLTSPLAPMLNLSYIRMLWMAIPYTIVLTTSGLFCVLLFL